MSTYELAGEALVPNSSRECGHPFLREAGECELCDIDCLLETDNADDPYEVEATRKDWLLENRPPTVWLIDPPRPLVFHRRPEVKP